MTEETIEYVHERYDRKRVVDTPEWDQSRASESEADLKASLSFINLRNISNKRASTGRPLE